MQADRDQSVVGAMTEADAIAYYQNLYHSLLETLGALDALS